MRRTSKVTFTATAVTLTCLAGAFYASPVVITETMGREVTAYSPVQHGAFTQDREETRRQITDASTSGIESSMTHEGTWHTVESDQNLTSSSAAQSTAPESVDIAAPKPEPRDPKTTSEPSETPTSRITSEIPQVELTPPESQTSEPDASEFAGDPEDPEETANPDEAVPDDVDSPDSTTVIVNKRRALPDDYIPDDLVELSTEFTDETQQLREEATDAAEDMFVAAQEDDIALQAVSSFRSYEYQRELYDGYLEQYGDDNTEGLPTRPGHSEHQTGLALDIDSVEKQHTLKASFGQTGAGQWLAAHPHEYVFVIRYPEDERDITGFHYEPWHFRYFGEQFAKRIFENSEVAEKNSGLNPRPTTRISP